MNNYYCNNGGKIENQRNSSWCSAFSTTSYLTAYYSRILGKKIEFSPLFAMRNAKKVDGNKNSTGTYLTKLMDEIIKNGCCEQSLYHEDTDKDWLDNQFSDPSKEAIENAKKYKPYKKVKIDVTVDSLKSAVVNNTGCVLALNIFDTYFNSYKSVYIRKPKGDEEGVVGRHAIYLCGYDDNLSCEYDGKLYKGFFILQESYGEKGSTKGYKFLPYEFIEKRVGGKYSCDRFVDEAYVFEYRKDEDKYKEIDKDFKINVYKKTVRLTIGDDFAYIDGNKTKLQCSPIIENGRTLVPLRFIAEALGGSTYYSSEDKSIRIFSKEPNYLIEMKLGDKTIVKSAYGKSQTITSDVPPIVKNGYTLVPIRVISETLNCNVDYIPYTKEIIITEQ